jgi:hypothetical protein
MLRCTELHPLPPAGRCTAAWWASGLWPSFAVSGPLVMQIGTHLLLLLLAGRYPAGWLASHPFLLLNPLAHCCCCCSPIRCPLQGVVQQPGGPQAYGLPVL